MSMASESSPLCIIVSMIVTVQVYVAVGCRFLADHLIDFGIYFGFVLISVLSTYSRVSE